MSCQGQPEKMKNIWGMDQWEEELAKLSSEVGYPFGHLWDKEGKRDRVFLQDKFSYIVPMQEFFLPSHKVELTENGLLSRENLLALILYVI
jgi:hypothetical protein